MNTGTIWDNRRHRIVTRKGGWRIGQGIRVGSYSLLDAMVGTHSFFELLVQLLQAYVFALLTALYLAASLSEEH